MEPFIADNGVQHGQRVRDPCQCQNLEIVDEPASAKTMGLVASRSNFTTPSLLESGMNCAACAATLTK